MNAPAGSKEHEGGTRLLVGALIAGGLLLALFIAFVVPSLIEDEGDEPGVVAGGEQSPGPAASPTAGPSPTPAASPTPGTPPTPADGPSPTPAPSPTAGSTASASPGPGPTSKEPPTPASAEPKPVPAPPPAAPAPAAPAPAAPAPAAEQMFPVAHAENGQSYAAVYVKRDGEWVALAEAIGNDAPKITP